VTVKLRPALTDPTAPWIDPRNGLPTVAFFQYLSALDRAVRALLPAADIGQSVAFANLPDGTAGDIIFVSDGLKAGESTGSGTGVLAYYDGSHWIAVDTGSTVAN
jgi:hypothetical protein